MRRILEDKRWIGIILAIIIEVVFVGISLLVLSFLSGVPWFVFSSVLRIAFGVVILVLINKIYGKSPKELLSFSNTKLALISGIGFLVFFAYYLIDYATGFESFVGLSVGIVISRVFLQQITTGFFEELNYRVLVLEGYRYGKKSVDRKIVYALISFVLFGLLHVVTGWNTYTFLQTGVIGFAFAVIYLNSGNIIIPMILHFIYDVFANSAGYIKWNDSELHTSIDSVFKIALLVMFLVSFVSLFRKEKVIERGAL